MKKDYPYPITGGGYQRDIESGGPNPGGIPGFATGFPMPVDLMPVEGGDGNANDMPLTAADAGVPYGHRPSSVDPAGVDAHPGFDFHPSRDRRHGDGIVL